MDDWGLSVWDTPSDGLQTTSQLKFTENAFAGDEDSTDLGEVTDFVSSKTFTDDDFGDDFGEFGDGDHVSFGDNEDMVEFGDEDTFQDFPPLPTWEPLRLDPWPSPTELAASVDSLLQTTWKLPSLSTFLTNDNIRQVEGPNQILVTPERHEDFTFKFFSLIN